MNEQALIKKLKTDMLPHKTKSEYFEDQAALDLLRKEGRLDDQERLICLNGFIAWNSRTRDGKKNPDYGFTFEKK